VKLLAGDEADENLLAGLKEELKAVQKRLNEASQQLRAAQAKRRETPAKLNLGQVLSHVARLRDTLTDDVPAAAESVRLLTGPIRVSQRKVPGRRGAAWVARLRPKLAELLSVSAELSAGGSAEAT
jgi:hypothetical protein